MSEKVKPTPEERKAATAELRKKHQPTFDALGIPDAKYIPKMAHHVKGLQGLHMGFFVSELNHGEDVYTEMVSIMMESEDPTRTLYKWRYNPHFESELAPSDEVITQSTRYYVPMDELEIVPPKKKRGRPRKKIVESTDMHATPTKEAIRTVDDEVDMPMEKMTIRDYIAIHKEKPVSLKPWINEIIMEEF